jgi:hypothetical protein
MFWASLLFIPVVILLLLLVPYLADYAAMNFVLFVIVFALGFCTARLAGISFWSLLAIYGVSVFVGLNPQVPVPSISIINSFLGLATGMLISALVGRLIWPVLPQEVFREDLLKFYEQLKKLLNRDRHVEKIRTALAILPVQAQQAAHQIPIRRFSDAEKAKVDQLIKFSQALVLQCSMLVSNRYVFPEPIEVLLRPDLSRLEAGFSQMLDVFVECFRKGDCRRPFPSLREAVASLNENLRIARETGKLIQLDLDTVMQVLEVTNRHQSMAEALEECSTVMRSMELHRYTGDCSL